MLNCHFQYFIAGRFARRFIFSNETIPQIVSDIYETMRSEILMRINLRDILQTSGTIFDKLDP